MQHSLLRFEWDTAKQRANTRKHRVSFIEARSVFYDPSARLIEDPDHSGDEDRFVLLGMSARFRLLVVCHSYRDEQRLIRIISARKATRHESQGYRGGKHEKGI